MPHTLWSVVLAGGSGRRLSGITGGVPKQFWSAAGGPSLLEDTLERSASLAAPHQTVVVVDRTHAPFVSALPRVASQHRVIYQPCDKGTAAGVLLGLTKVAAVNPNAVVFLTPSDHGFRRPTIFADGIRRAAREVIDGGSKIVLFGVPPTSPDGDYGWITPGTTDRPDGFRPVDGFVEKPSTSMVRELFETGAVWNTMVLVGRVSDLLELYRRQTPLLYRAFQPLMHIDGPAHAAYVQNHYATLPVVDFSREVITGATDLCVYTWPVSLGWSDLGTPERLERWGQEHIIQRSLRARTADNARPVHYA
jgi:mannose-1-phosphate guanylyltransferase